MAREAEELALQAERIRKLREQKAHREGRRVPQPEVADAVGVTLRAYQAWEAGDSDIDPSNLKALAKFFDVSADFIEYGDRSTPDLLRSIEDPPDIMERLAGLEEQVRLLRAETAARDAEVLKRIDEALPPTQEAPG